MKQPRRTALATGKRLARGLLGGVLPDRQAVARELQGRSDAITWAFLTWSFLEWLFT